MLRLGDALIKVDGIGNFKLKNQPKIIKYQYVFPFYLKNRQIIGSSIYVGFWLS